MTSIPHRARLVSAITNRTKLPPEVLDRLPDLAALAKKLE